MKKQLSILLLVLLAVFSVCGSALAHDVPDATQQGSISVTMRMGQTAVGGGSLTLYRVGGLQSDDGDYSFVPAGEFAGYGAAFDNVQSPALAAELAAYAKKHSIAGTTKRIDGNGTVTFDGLELGLYLLVQQQAASGYQKADPFLVTVPQTKDGAYVYAVDASPKVELERAPSPSPTPAPKLPQTGQLNWPVPVLAVLGVALFMAGWALCFGQRKNRDEE